VIRRARRERRVAESQMLVGGDVHLPAGRRRDLVLELDVSRAAVARACAQALHAGSQHEARAVTS